MTRYGVHGSFNRLAALLATTSVTIAALFGMGHLRSGVAAPAGSSLGSELKISHSPPPRKTIRAGRSVVVAIWLTNPGPEQTGPVKVCARVGGLPRRQLRLNHSCRSFRSIQPERYRRASWRLIIDPTAEGRAVMNLSVFGGPRSRTVRKTALKILPVTAKPEIRQRPIPFGKDRKMEMARYSKRHYGRSDWRLRRPKQIVEHYAVASSLNQIFNAFRPDKPDPEFGEKPNVCAHFAVDGAGKIQQFVNLGIRCRHVVGLNHVTIGIEHTDFSAQQVLSDSRQMRSSLKLTRWLRCRYSIPVKDVIGHNESLSSPYYREKVRRMRGQTHGDFTAASMTTYRKRLRALGPC